MTANFAEPILRAQSQIRRAVEAAEFGNYAMSVAFAIDAEAALSEFQGLILAIISNNPGTTTRINAAKDSA